jgi:hypothetical protein
MPPKTNKHAVEDAPPLPPAEEKPRRNVSAISVLLEAVEIAQARGAYKMNEIGMISQAHAMLKAEEQKKIDAANPGVAEEKDS